MRLAVTGGSGRIGRVVSLAAAEHGHEVVIVDQVPPGPGIGADYRQTSMSDYNAVRAALAGADTVIHLAALPGPNAQPEHVVHNNNVTASYNVLTAAADAGISRVVMASSVNAIGASWSRAPSFDYFPVDERHPTYNEDGYSLSKWIGEQQADSVTRRFGSLSVISLRIHAFVADRAAAEQLTQRMGPDWAARGLWGYTTHAMLTSACLLACTANVTGHQVLWVVADHTASPTPSQQLRDRYYPNVPLRSPLLGTCGFFDCTTTRQVLGWSAAPTARSA
jgi:nucleoside-diphosphate-sugar epimerase